MSIKLQIILFIGSCFVMYFMFRLIKKETLQLKYSLLWIFIVAILILMSIFPNILYIISDLLGILVPSNTLFLLGMLFELMIVFSLTVALSKSSERVKALSQEIALLRKDMNNYSEKQKK